MSTKMQLLLILIYFSITDVNKIYFASQIPQVLLIHHKVVHGLTMLPGMLIDLLV